MKKAKWIWIDNDKPDVHAEFKRSFQSVSTELKLKLSCDGNYVVFLNGKYVGFGQMSDYEYYKTLDEYDLREYAVAGENELRIVVWHIGVNSVNYRAERAGVCFEITEGERIAAYSDEDALSRIVSGYAQGYCKMIAQVGITSLYDFTKEEESFKKSVRAVKEVTFAPSNVQNLKILPKVSGRVLTREKKRVLVDLGEEYLGFLHFSVESKAQDNAFTVFFGEHLLPNGQVLRKIATCHFGLDFIAKKGRNEFQDYLRPIGCRYLEIVSDKEIEVERLGIMPFQYPFKEAGLALRDPLDKRIYEVCIHTLKCCAAKHYMDCPWREQGMYVLDSRNQMLCGYYAFKEYALPRFNLIMLSKGMTNYGILSSSPPSAQDSYIIPFFSLIYIVQVYEYVTHSGDVSVIAEVEEVLHTIMRTFLGRIDEKGLIPRFSCDHFWNFYEWTEGSNGWPCDEKSAAERKDAETYDLILNAAFVLAAEKYALLLEKIGKSFVFPSDGYRKRIKELFYDEDRGLFRLNSRTKEYSRLGCSFALLARVATGAEAERAAENMLNDEGVIDCSLACAGYFYDALLRVDEKYKEYVLKDIRTKYKYMLDSGATTFWETLNGSEENGGIGSLCHAWSAMPVYYYHKYYSK